MFQATLGFPPILSQKGGWSNETIKFTFKDGSTKSQHETISFIIVIFHTVNSYIFKFVSGKEIKSNYVDQYSVGISHSCQKTLGSKFQAFPVKSISTLCSG